MTYDRTRTPEPRNNYGFPLADAPAYLPREQARDIPIVITMEDEDPAPPIFPAWSLFAAVVVLVSLAAYAWVWP